jgi:hypothetical protein
MKILNRMRTVLLSLCTLLLVTQQTSGEVTLQLISARDQIEGQFLGNQAVYADEDRIYIASFQGKLFVLARDRSANFPLLEIVQDTARPLTAVRGDARNLYVTSGDGNLRVYRKEHPLLLVDTVPLSVFGLSSLAVRGRKLYVGTGQADLRVDDDHVYLSAANNILDIGLEIVKKTLTPGLIYGQTFEPFTTVVFDRMNGDRIFGIPNPRDRAGNLVRGVNLYVDRNIIAQTIGGGGAGGPGVFIYDPETFVLERMIDRPFTNTVTRSRRWLIAGNEGGRVDLFDLRQSPSPLISSADLPRLTGRTGIAEIEIRALWEDNVDNLIFAASSWQTQDPSVPSFFVLELVKGN